ncbi:M14 family zinc carboxypeptidase [Pendulispora albinea]|uniref:Peptidase M14 n=1 Tax=Pendulispora albinea TaxID=2741071 RepID=A0ABZ2LRR5_9BACT
MGMTACQATAPQSPASTVPTSATSASSTEAAQGPGSLVTEAERSGFRRTGRYEEVERLCRAYERTYPNRARCVSFGTTPEGRPMLAIAASEDGVLSPEAARAKHRPVVFFQGGIHAGEIDGKDGGFLMLRELLDGKRLPGATKAVTAVFIPVLNVDGHERFAPNQRPNQRGPEEMGFRTNAQNFNINRDYLKAEVPETHAILRFLEAWDPVVYIDLHATDGAKFEHDVAIMIEPTAQVPGGLEAVARKLSDEVMARMKAAGHLPLHFYPSFRKTDDPTSGFAHMPPPPRFSQGYAALRNRIGILIETHSWRPHPHRVKTVHDFLAAFFDRARTDAEAWRKAADVADAADAHLAGLRVPLSYKVTESSHIIEFRGYAYQKRPSEVSGGSWTVYDESRPEIWRIPLFETLEPDVTAEAPKAGFVVPAAQAEWVGAKLRIHGLRYEVMKTARPAYPVVAYRADEVTYAPSSFESRTPVTVKGTWRSDTRDLPAGSLFVPIAQPRARLLLHLFEPQAPDSLVAWGFFNGAFERKEYMEDYVAEEEARKMLAANPALRTEFEARLKDPKFAADPKARLDFFYKRHPAWDERVNLVPIYKVATSPISGR